MIDNKTFSQLQKLEQEIINYNVDSISNFFKNQKLNEFQLLISKLLVYKKWLIVSLFLEKYKNFSFKKELQQQMFEYAQNEIKKINTNENIYNKF